MAEAAVSGTAAAAVSLSPMPSRLPHPPLLRPLAAFTRAARARPRLWIAAALLAAGLGAGCSALETQQRKWLFQATATPASVEELERFAAARDMEAVWVEHASEVAGRPIRLHGLWAENENAKAPAVLYLHGVRRDVARNTWRIERLRELGFSVLAIDYRGFGNSTDVLPSEAGVIEDAAAAWKWLAEREGSRDRYLFGHSLGGAVAVQLAAELADAPPAAAPKGVIIEATFTSIGELLSSFRWGWLPFSMLITERFDSLAAVPKVKAPLLIVHGSDDTLVPSRFGQQLYEKATAPKRFVLVEGGTHSSSSWRGDAQLRQAMKEFFGLKSGA